jgi:hypothetical protein
VDEQRAAIDEPWQATARRVYAGYLVLQGAAGIALWVFLASANTVRELFELVPDRPTVTDSFVLADLLLGVVGSTLAAWALWNGRAWARTALAFTVGALLYPTCYLVIWVALEGTGAVALAVMVVVTSLTSWIWLHASRLHS